jgi:hypothetical protein
MTRPPQPPPRHTILDQLQQGNVLAVTLDEALASGGICYVLESEWNQYVAAQQRGHL